MIRGDSTAGEELNKTEDRSFEVDSTGEGFRLGVSSMGGSPWRVLLVRGFDTSSVELVGE